MTLRGFRMSSWTVYRLPADFPATPYVVREFFIHRGQEPEPASEMVLCQTLDQARASVPPDAVCIHRSPGDDPTIVETWL